VTISITTPTTPDRQIFIDRLAVLIEAQTVQPLEWLIDINPGTIGAKRNRLNKLAKGDIIIPFDSDDIYLPQYIETAIAALRQSCKRLVYSHKFPIHSVRNNTVHILENGTSEATMCYYRDSVTFPDTSYGEGAKVLSNTPHASYYNPHFMATVHGANTCGHKALALIKKADPEEAALILSTFYTTLEQ